MWVIEVQNVLTSLQIWKCEMKKYLTILAWVLAGTLIFASQGWGVCPEDTVDNGICDTMRVEIWPGDQEPGGFPLFARFPIYITHDNPDPVDSIAAFVLPFCYTHTNSSKYCSVSSYWNRILWSAPDLPRSIFRHLPSNDNPVVHNWMMDLYEAGDEEEWNQVILDLDGTSHFWLTLIPAGSEDSRFGSGSQVLLATMTFRLEDTMVVCIDSCFWPPSAHLWFSRADAMPYVPRHNLPMCQRILYYVPPILWLNCPVTQNQHTNGSFVAHDFSASESGCPDFATLAGISLSFIGDGVTGLAFNPPFVPGGCDFSSNINYTVVDHCAGGGSVRVVVHDSNWYADTCFFGINLFSTLPELSVPDSIFALTDHIASLPVSATDADNDAVTTSLNALWFANDSLQSPVNSPSYNGNNPGTFSWVPTDADVGTWIASFSATDVCGKADTARVMILVGTTSCGDCTNDSVMDVADVVYLINYLFKGGAAPDPICQGDVNCSGLADVGDVILLINYLYKGGTAPCFGCCG
jgi:hypothetical protein